METCVEVGHPYRGMGESEVRSGRGWPHQMPLVILAHGWLVQRPFG
jgi:hypothetical protein